VQIECCHQSTKKGEIVRAYLSLMVLVIDDNAFYGLTVCIEHFRYSNIWHKMVLFPLVKERVNTVQHFFSVDLSGRKSVLLRGGPLWKGLGGINMYTTPYAPTYPSRNMEDPTDTAWANLQHPGGSTAQARGSTAPAVLLQASAACFLALVVSSLLAEVGQ
jgi:hypothetical protein